MKCKVIEVSSCRALEQTIQAMLDDGHEIANVSLTSYKTNYSVYFTAVILYK